MPPTRPGPEDAQLAAWRSFLHAGAALSHLLGQELLDDQDLPASWYEVLLKLNEAGGRLRMQELAAAVLVTKSGLTRLLDRMVEAGVVDREPCPSDRRGWHAVLTPEGKARLRKASPGHLRGIQQHFGALVDDDEARVLREVCDRLLEHVRQVTEGCDVDDDDAAATPRGS